MNIDDQICSLWTSLRKLLKSAVQFASSTAKTLAKTAIAILGDVIETIDDALEGVFGSGGAGSFFLIAAALVAAYFVLSDEDKEKEKGSGGSSNAVQPNPSGSTLEYGGAQWR